MFATFLGNPSKMRRRVALANPPEPGSPTQKNTMCTTAEGIETNTQQNPENGSHFDNCLHVQCSVPSAVVKGEENHPLSEKQQSPNVASSSAWVGQPAASCCGGFCVLCKYVSRSNMQFLRTHEQMAQHAYGRAGVFPCMSLGTNVLREKQENTFRKIRACLSPCPPQQNLAPNITFVAPAHHTSFP